MLGFKTIEESERLRKVVFLTLLAWMLAGPICEQVFGARRWWLRSWRMYSSVGIGLIEARFFEARNGELREIQWPPPRRSASPRHISPPPSHRLSSARELSSVVEQLCDRLGSGADVRAVARRGVRTGWMPFADGKDNLCESGRLDESAR